MGYLFPVSGGGFLRRVHPLAKIVCAMAVFVVSVAAHSVTAAALYFVMVFALLAASRLAWPTLKMLLLLAPLALLIVGINWLITPSLDGAVIAGLRIGFFGMSMVLFAFTTTPAELVRSLESARCPRMLALGILIAVRFAPVFLDEARRIAASARLRGGAFRRDLFFLYRATVVPLIYRLFTVSDTLTLSLHTRGFRPVGPRTQYRSVRFTLPDAAFLGAFLAVSALAAVV